jgi:hypothetical protein
MLSNVECIFLKPACEGEIRLTSSANEFNRLFNILVKTLLPNRMLNCSITDTEIENVVRNLPNNKEVGTDCIRNEYLKSTLMYKIVFFM